MLHAVMLCMLLLIVQVVDIKMYLKGETADFAALLSFYW